MNRFLQTPWMRTALIAWAILLAITILRPLARPVTGTVFTTYAKAGEEFAAGRRLYDVPHPYTDNFRYSPIVAAGFVPFSWLPLGVGGLVWRLLSASIFLTGLAAWKRHICPDALNGAFFLLAIPLSIASLHNGQANTLVTGLLLWSTVSAASGRWIVAGTLVGGAVLLKLHPVAFGALLVLLAPLRFGLPLAATIAAGFALPFALGSPEYISDQYRFWVQNLGNDDRSGFALHAGLQDVQMLFRVVGIDVPLASYRLVQAATGGLIAMFVVVKLWQGRDTREVAADAFSLYACWLLTFGPAVETSTYIFLAPLMARELVDRRGQPKWAWRVAVMSAVLFVAIRLSLALLPRNLYQPFIALGVYPVASLLMAVAVCGRIANRPVRRIESNPSTEPTLRLAA
jgi:hypothetical protein